MYIALDLGTNTGWAVYDHQWHSPARSGVQSFTPSRFEGGGMRYLKFQRWLDTLVAPLGPGFVERLAFEEVRRHEGTTAAHVYGGFLATLTAWCESNKIPYEAALPGTIKRHATGKGNASKDMVKDAMRAKGYTPKDDNEADALALLHWMLDNYGTPSTPHLRPASDRQPARRVQVEALRLPRRPVSR